MATVAGPESEVALYHNCSVLLASVVFNQVDTSVSKMGKGLVFSNTNVMEVFAPAPFVALNGGLGNVVRVVCALVTDESKIIGGKII